MWRRTTLEEYRSDTPQWEVLINVDALRAADAAQLGEGGFPSDYEAALRRLAVGHSLALRCATPGSRA
jgi:prolyl oligopeptidase